MGECKTKAIQTNLGTFSHNLAYPGIIQAYSGIFRTLCYPAIFKTVVCPEPWNIQNEKHIQNLGIFTTLIHSEPRYIQNYLLTYLSWLSHLSTISAGWACHGCLQCISPFGSIIYHGRIFTNYNYFRKAFPVEINILR